MSQCSLDNYKDGYEVTIGWDGPLKTYFASVVKLVGEGEEGEDEGPLILEGTRYNEYPTPEPLIDIVKPYATSFDSSLLLSILELDKRTNSERQYFFQDTELCVCNENKEDLLQKLQEKGFCRRLDL